MRRRTYLAALPALALAGCSTNGGSDGDGTNRTPPGAGYDHFREVRIDAVDGGGLADTPLSASVSAENLRITADSTATVTVRIENGGSEAVGVERTRCPPADLREGVRTDGEKRLLLMRDGEYGGDRAAGASDVCWRPSHFDLRGGEPCRVVGRTLDPGATWEREYRVWDDPGNRECLPPGPYAFESALALVDPSAVTDGATTGTAADGTATDVTRGSETEPGAPTGSANGTTPPETTTAAPSTTWSFTVGIYDPGMASPTATDGE